MCTCAVASKVITLIKHWISRTSKSYRIYWFDPTLSYSNFLPSSNCFGAECSEVVFLLFIKYSYICILWCDWNHAYADILACRQILYLRIESRVVVLGCDFFLLLAQRLSFGLVGCRNTETYTHIYQCIYTYLLRHIQIYWLYVYVTDMIENVYMRAMNSANPG